MKLLHHRYLQNVHIFDDPVLSALIARASVSETDGIATGLLADKIFAQMAAHFVAEQFPQTEGAFVTRMNASLSTWVTDPTQEVTCINVARAGDEPSLAIYRWLADIVDPKHLHRDHLMSSRTLDENHHVTGAEQNGFKPSGPTIDGQILIIPDPMGATGGSVSDLIKFYKQRGTPTKIIVCWMIVTPECLKRITTEHPDVIVYAGRLDRGLSEPDVLADVPGAQWDRERGLTEIQYISPGAGGMGEVMNNALS